MKAKASVVLVDDDTAFRQVLAGELERAGWTVTPAACGAEALRAVRDVEPLLVLLDLRLPDMSGLDVLKAIRERSPSSDVIVLTGHGSPSRAHSMSWKCAWSARWSGNRFATARTCSSAA
jgi:DNA-binding NtrC family response regulator